MGVPLVILTFLGAKLPGALDHPSTKAAAAVALILPPDQVNYTQGFGKPVHPKMVGFPEILRTAFEPPPLSSSWENMLQIFLELHGHNLKFSNKKSAKNGLEMIPPPCQRFSENPSSFNGYRFP